MLRVGLTGGLGSGKSTVAGRFRALGASVMSADDLGREMMQPGQPVFNAIVAHFGTEVLGLDGGLNRAVLADLAFAKGRVAELNAIVHPAVLARQVLLAEDLFRHDPQAVLMVESALLFETEHAGATGWQSRFDRIIVVVAADAIKIDRYVARTAAGAILAAEARAADARARLQQQISDTQKVSWADFAIDNNGSLQAMQAQVDQIWPLLQAEARGQELVPGRQ